NSVTRTTELESCPTALDPDSVPACGIAYETGSTVDADGYRGTYSLANCACGTEPSGRLRRCVAILYFGAHAHGLAAFSRRTFERGARAGRAFSLQQAAHGIHRGAGRLAVDPGSIPGRSSRADA